MLRKRSSRYYDLLEARFGTTSEALEQAKLPVAQPTALASDIVLTSHAKIAAADTSSVL